MSPMDIDFNQRLKPIKKGHVLKVRGHDYSHGTNVHQHGALRYRIAGGYVTGNSRYVKVVR
ncbi:hypothetical protein [Lentilactobacillus rapi]|uniref:Uncharacterized protein n=2 Tax=Lentilactobacillus rapi TaxID=481723 RepID=A0A512PNR6_9LACO|nr:hypothetical protein [Lentilactobacillus rapi]GEP72847.1 hypothetical protein LRA02_17150 [Lentilactobacillus rapi]